MSYLLNYLIMTVVKGEKIKTMKTSKRFASVYGVVIILALVAVLSAGCGGSKQADANAAQQTQQETGTDAAAPAATTEAAAETAAEASTVPATFDPNPGYDKYAMVDYMVEDIGAEFTATVSAKEDDSEFEVHCNLDGVEQIVVLDKDHKIVSDKTGNMSYDAPLVVEKAIEEGNWTEISK